MKCEIIRDLFPSYIDGLTSEQSNEEIQKHLETCPACKSILNEMKIEIQAETIEKNPQQINPFRKWKQKKLKAVLATLGCCILLFCGYFYFFFIGWSVNSNDVKITYTCDDTMMFIDFELTNGKVLNAWPQVEKDSYGLKFSECFHSMLDNRPNQFTYGMPYLDSDGKPITFSSKDSLTLHFKNDTKKIYWKNIQKKLNLSK